MDSSQSRPNAHNTMWYIQFDFFVLAVLFSLSFCQAGDCSFCGLDADGLSHTFDLSIISNFTHSLRDKRGEIYFVTSPCDSALTFNCIPPSSDPVIQGCRGVGTLSGKNASVELTQQGFNIMLGGGSNNPPCGPGEGHRSSTFQFICDKTKPVDNPPEPNVTENPGCHYTVTWRHPHACDPMPAGSKSACAPLPPAPAPIPWVDTRLPTYVNYFIIWPVKTLSIKVKINK